MKMENLPAPVSTIRQFTKSLSTPGPTRHYAIVGLFEIVSKRHGSEWNNGELERAIISCLCFEDAVAVGLATEKLLQNSTVGRIPIEVSERILFTSLSAAKQNTIGILSSAVVELYVNNLSYPVSQKSEPSPPWKFHPLVKALLANPGAAGSLLSAAARLLTRKKETPMFNVLFQSLIPFLDSLIFTEVPEYPNQYSSIVYGKIARIGGSEPHARDACYEFLIHRLPFLTMDSLHAQNMALQNISESLDLLYFSNCDYRDASEWLVVNEFETYLCLCELLNRAMLAHCIAEPIFFL